MTVPTKPFDTEVEKRVISFMAWNHVAIERYSQTIQPAHFSDELLREIFTSLRDCFLGSPSTYNTIEALKRVQAKSAFKEVALSIIEQWLKEHMIGCSDLNMIKFYEQKIHESFVARGVQWVADSLIASRDTDETAMERFERITKEFKERVSKFDFEVPSLEDQTISMIENQDSLGSILTTGNTFLDMHELVQRSGNTVLAALPGRGKTGFAIYTAVKAARRGLRVAYFSFEMNDAQILTRAHMANLCKPRAFFETMTPELSESMGQLNGKLFVFGSKGKMKVGEILASCRQLKSAAGGCDLVVVDHMGLVAPDKRSTTYEERSQVSRDLKMMSTELDCGLLNLCQLNRSVAEEEPQMRHLRDTGRIEEDATSIVFLHRPNRKVTENLKMLVAKNRDGLSESNLDLTFDPIRSQFKMANFNERLNDFNEED